MRDNESDADIINEETRVPKIAEMFNNSAG